MSKKLTQEEVIEKIKNVCGDKYDYSLVEYKNSRTKIKLKCIKHNYVFEKIYPSIIEGQNGCIFCAFEKEQKNNSINFIQKAKKIHGDKYDYSLVDYKDQLTKIKIICPEHGVFEQKPFNHITLKRGCNKCSFLKRAKSKTLTTEDFIQKAKQIHGDKYDYSLVEYKNSRTKIKIICPEHGIFEQKANNHLNGQGCFKCKLKKQAEEQLFTTEDFIQKAKKIHGDKYDYSLVNYNGIRTKIKIICPEHGIFEQTAFDHLANCGCKVCKDSRGERKIFIFLKNKKIIFETQKTFSNLKDINPLSYDFYLPNYNLLIEYNGIQHYKAINYFGGYKRFLIQKHHDWLKRKYAKKNGIKLLTISYLEFDNIDKILKENLSGC